MTDDIRDRIKAAVLPAALSRTQVCVLRAASGGSFVGVGERLRCGCIATAETLLGLHRLGYVEMLGPSCTIAPAGAQAMSTVADWRACRVRITPSATAPQPS